MHAVQPVRFTVLCSLFLSHGLSPFLMCSIFFSMCAPLIPFSTGVWTTTRVRERRRDKERTIKEVHSARKLGFAVLSGNAGAVINGAPIKRGRRCSL